MDQFRNKFWHHPFRSRGLCFNTELETDVFDLCDLDIHDLDMECPSDSESGGEFEFDV